MGEALFRVVWKVGAEARLQVCRGCRAKLPARIARLPPCSDPPGTGPDSLLAENFFRGSGSVGDRGKPPPGLAEAFREAWIFGGRFLEKVRECGKGFAGGVEDFGHLVFGEHWKKYTRSGFRVGKLGSIG